MAECGCRVKELVGEMAYERMGETTLDYLPCRYGGCRLLFRGPQRRLEGSYAAFLGGTETYGKFIERPFPALVEARTGLRCVNFGWPNAGVDVFLNEPELLKMAGAARVVVLQVPCAPNLSNRYYSVHPRRNDRFVTATPRLQSLFPEVDFTEFHFTRHLLSRLRRVSRRNGSRPAPRGVARGDGIDADDRVLLGRIGVSR